MIGELIVVYIASYCDGHLGIIGHYRGLLSSGVGIGLVTLLIS